jgi:hypothetical protein
VNGQNPEFIMRRDPIIYLSPTFEADITVLNGVTLSSADLGNAISTIAAEATRVADKLANQYSASLTKVDTFDLHAQLRLMSHMERAQRYGHLASTMHYLLETRTPLLPDSQEIELYIDECASDSFVRLVNGQPYSLDAMSHHTDWFDNIAKAVDPSIAKWKLHRAANRYSPARLFNPKLADPFKKASTIAALKLSAAGRDVLKEVDQTGYNIYFVDFRLHNYRTRDLSKRKAMASCSTNEIFVDVSLPVITSAIKLAHECGHGVQFHRHHHYSRYSRLSQKGLDDNLYQFSATHEAHSISFEYVVAAELLRAGVDPNAVHAASLYDLPSETINLLRDRPRDFLEAADLRDVIQKRWRFKNKHMKTSSTLTRLYANSMRPLPCRWEDLPQPTR